MKQSRLVIALDMPSPIARDRLLTDLVSLNPIRLRNEAPGAAGPYSTTAKSATSVQRHRSDNRPPRQPKPSLSRIILKLANRAIQADANVPRPKNATPIQSEMLADFMASPAPPAVNTPATAASPSHFHFEDLSTIGPGNRASKSDVRSMRNSHR